MPQLLLVYSNHKADKIMHQCNISCHKHIADQPQQYSISSQLIVMETHQSRVEGIMLQITLTIQFRISPKTPFMLAVVFYALNCNINL